MENDLSAFFLKRDEGATPSSVAPRPVGASRIPSTPRPAVATQQPVTIAPTEFNNRTVAEVYLNSNEPETAEPATPVTKVAAVTNEQIAENTGETWNTVFPPAPVAKPRRRMVESEMPSLGILDSLMADDRVHDILISGTQPIYVDIGGQLEDSGLRFETHEEVWKLAETIMNAIDQHWNGDRQLIDTRLPDGSRVNIVAPPMAVDGVSISIRKFPTHQITLETMVARNQLSPELAEFLRIAVVNRLNIIVSGGTSSGKTTLLNALSASVSPRERIVTIEDSAELRLQQPHVIRLEAKPARGLDAPETAVTIRDLVKNALRMRPDRIIVGESRGPEAFDVLQAMNTGHDGSMTTLHANAPRDALSRLETMVSIAMPQLPPRVVRQQIASTVQLMIQMTRTKDGQRRITHVSEISGMEGETLMMQDLITWNDGSNGRPQEYRWSGGAPRNLHVTEAARESGMLRGLR